jgi:hypothetical protein
MQTKVIRWMGHWATLACDAKCNKAWGVQARPKVQLGPDDDDFAWLADSELVDAPNNPGTWEGGDGKPSSPEGMNKWCARECERSDVALIPDRISLPNFGARVLNQPWRHAIAPEAQQEGRTDASL